MLIILHIYFHRVRHPTHVEQLDDVRVFQIRQDLALSFGESLERTCTADSYGLASDDLGHLL